MTEILTESFCERCGTRYTFEAVGTRRPLRSIGTLGRGLRHFLTDSGSTLEESLAVARSEIEQQATGHALEAFHRTFNFCLSCRQYVCGECWNAVEGRCLSCEPMAVQAPPMAPQIVPDAAPPAAPAAPLDIPPPTDALPPTEVLAPPDTPPPPVDEIAQPAVVMAAPPVPLEAEPASGEEPPPVSGPLVGLQRGRSLDAEIAAYEERLAADREALATEPEGAAEPAPPAAAVEPEPEPPDLPVAPEPELPAAAARPEPATAATPLELLPPLPIQRPAEGASADRGPGAQPGGARACPSCGLSLSASARFCRRCGTAQQAG